MMVAEQMLAERGLSLAHATIMRQPARLMAPTLFARKVATFDQLTRGRVAR
jgi:hypothetical protein